MASASQGDVKLKIRKFDIAGMRESPCIVIAAKRGSGKTTLVRDILYHKQSIPTGLVMSGTEEANSFYGNLVPSTQIRSEYSSEVMRKVFARQKELLKRDDVADKRAFVIMDDMQSDSKVWARDTEIKRIFMNGRHYNITYILTMQYPIGIGPELRGNADYIFILRENNHQNRRRLYESYAGIFPKFNVFCQVLDTLTDNYGSMVIDNTRSSTSLTDCVFWYKAEVHPPFRLCSDKMWRLDAELKRRREATGEDPNEVDGMDLLQKMKNQPRVMVQKIFDDAAMA